MAKSSSKNTQQALSQPSTARRFHSVRYQDSLTLRNCWLPFMGEGAIFVPAHPVKPWLGKQLPSQVLLLHLPEGQQYCLAGRIIMILPAGTGPGNRGGYLMLLHQPPDEFLEHLASVHAHPGGDREGAPKPYQFTNLPEWLLCCADNNSSFTLQ